ncbi:MAG: Mpo1-like protein [Bacteroidia bacterium]
MKTIHEWLSEYGESHQNQTNKMVHWVCVPLIMFSLIGLLWCIPTPELFKSFNFPINYGTLFLLFALCYYTLLSIRLTIGMLIITGAIVLGNYYIEKINIAPLWIISVGIFVAAWIGQFIGHNIEGKKPSFFKDLQFLLIGPLWIMSFIYKKLNIAF